MNTRDGRAGRYRSIVVVAGVVCLSGLMVGALLSGPVRQTLAAPGMHCFAETSYCISRGMLLTQMPDDPTRVPEEPTVVPGEPTRVPEEPTVVPGEPRPTEPPYEPTRVPEEPTVVPGEPRPTEPPYEPTRVPDEPRPTEPPYEPTRVPGEPSEPTSVPLLTPTRVRT